MRCPLDVDVDLVMTERQGVEIDYCPTCRGVWLDRGELDKILDRAASLPGPPADPLVGDDGGYLSAGAYPGAAPSSGGYPRGGVYGAHGAYGGDGDGRDRRPQDDDARRYDDDRPRYGEDRPRYGDDRPRYGEDRHGDDRHGEDRHGEDRHGQAGYPRKRRKESWLGDLLDFG